jgi:hypothetical protein
MLTALLYVPGGGFVPIPDPCARCREPRGDEGKVCSGCRAEQRLKQGVARFDAGCLTRRRKPCGCARTGPHRIGCGLRNRGRS